MVKLTTKEISQGKYEVLINDKHFGNFIMDVDGYFYYEDDLPKNSGLWAAWTLRLIADKLDEINEPWNSRVNQYFYESELF